MMAAPGARGTIFCLFLAWKLHGKATERHRVRALRHNTFWRLPGILGTSLRQNAAQLHNPAMRECGAAKNTARASQKLARGTL